MKATRILFISGVLLLMGVFVTGIYIVPKLQSGSPATARQSDASRVSLSDVFVDATYATPEFIKRVKLEPYLQQWQGRAQPFLIGINTHVGTIAHLDLGGKVLVEDSNGITTCICLCFRSWTTTASPFSRRNEAVFDW
jgi:hypothetical protein